MSAWKTAEEATKEESGSTNDRIRWTDVSINLYMNDSDRELSSARVRSAESTPVMAAGELQFDAFS